MLQSLSHLFLSTNYSVTQPQLSAPYSATLRVDVSARLIRARGRQHTAQQQKSWAKSYISTTCDSSS